MKKDISASSFSCICRIDRLNECLHSKEKSFKFMKIILVLLLCFEFLAIIYFNFFQMEYHLGFDASPIILKAKMIWQQKTLFPVNYEGQGNLLFDSPIFFSALIYGLTGNVLLGFSISNVCSAIIVLLLVKTICKDLGLSEISAISIGCLVLTPYVNPYYNTSNPIDYFPATFFSSAFLSGRVIYVLLILEIIILFEKKDKNKKLFHLLIALSIVIAFIYGISMGFALALYIVAPMLLYLVISMLIKQNLKELFSSKLIYAIILFICIAAGKYISVNILGYESKESTMRLITLDKFDENVTNTFLGLAKLMSCWVIDHKREVFSVVGILFLIRIGLLIVYCTGITYSFGNILKRTKTDDNPKAYYYILSFCVINFAIFFILDSTYGSPIFEERYLVIFYVISLFMFGIFLDGIKNNFLKCITVFLLFVLIFGVSLSSYCIMNIQKSDSSIQLKEVLNNYDKKIVYGYIEDRLDADEGIGIYIRNARVLDEDHIYKYIKKGEIYHWGDYTYYDDVGDYMDGTVLIAKSSVFETLPPIYKNNYVACEIFEDYTIYTSQRNVFDFETGLDEDGYSVDLPNSNGVKTTCTVNNNGAFQTNGTEEFALYGPYTETITGTYRFTLHYNVLEGNETAGTFEVALNNGTNILNSCEIRSDTDSCFIDVSFDEEGSIFEYRVFNYAGSSIEIKYIEMERIM